MKNCCFCWLMIGGDAVRVSPGRISPTPLIEGVGFKYSKDGGSEYAHEECFERAKAAFRAPVAVASTGGAR